jgi:YggT family protein
MTRNGVAEYVNTLVYLYLILILARIVLSYFTRIPYHPVLNAILKFIRDVTDPYLNLFRRIIPPVRAGPAALDLSPIVATFVLLFVGRIVVSLIAG